MGMEIVHKISSLPFYHYISLFVLKNTATDNDTVHVCKVSRRHISSAVPGTPRTPWPFPTTDVIFLVAVSWESSVAMTINTTFLIFESFHTWLGI